ncbi:Lipase [Vanrija pseudolonga]|uniref:Lipase n=1 Tax=Vanrija pseudolonga TaxID=143232 RepID=A0AAF1BPM5_9TREE|nr:Lipase [Vanrija pseudolonga]
MWYQLLTLLPPVQSLTTAPLPLDHHHRRRHLTRDEVLSLVHEAARYAALVYCGPRETSAWACGPHCTALGNISVLESGGDHGATPWCGSTVVVVAGTNPHSLASVADDLDIRRAVPTDDEFPGASAAGVTLHKGFYRTFRRLAPGVREGVVRSIAGDAAQHILVAGHSLGGALGHLLAVHLQRTLPHAEVHARLFASPRVGNRHWADYVDATFPPGQSLHVVNFNDMVPHLPLREWGFRHPAGEVWIAGPNSEKYVLCHGQEDDHCFSSVKTRVTGMARLRQYAGLGVHLGGYAGVKVGRESLCARGIAG